MKIIALINEVTYSYNTSDRDNMHDSDKIILNKIHYEKYTTSKYKKNFYANNSVAQSIHRSKILSLQIFFLIIFTLFSPTWTKLRSMNKNSPFINFKNSLKLQTNPTDNVSWSQIAGAVQSRLDFNIYIDMDKKVMDGFVRFHYKCTESTNYVSLDVNNLKINKVLNKENKEADYFIYNNDRNNTIGDALVIYSQGLCESKENSFFDIYYTTQPNSMGIHFSHPETLHDKRFTFLYTHGEAIYGRTFFPAQDTPSLKVEATARITIDEPYTALFSGKMITNKKINNSNKREFYFEMKHPIPTYLITFAAGNLVKKLMPNSRCEIYGEEKSLEHVNNSFEYCEAYIKFYEQYRKFFMDKMVFLITPDDFPFSGMENPYVTIISEAILSKDRSFTSTISHEIAHFWSGNLVTNKNWKSFWLNEGITTYLTRKSFRKIHGNELFFSEMHSGLSKLESAIEDLKKNPKSDDTQRSLYPSIKDDPYISFSRVPYEKGSFFIYYLETLLGEETMDKILSDYFHVYEFKNIDSDEFINFLKEKITVYKNSDAEHIFQQVQWMEWLKGTQKLPIAFKFDSEKVKEFESNINAIQSDKYTIKEFLKFLKPLNLNERTKIFKRLINKFSTLKSHTRQLLEDITKYEFIFDKHKSTRADLIIIKALFLSDAKSRIEYLKDSLLKFPYYKVLHLKKIFYLIKEKNPDKNFLKELLKQISNRINPIAFMRILEFIQGNNSKQSKS